MNLPAEQIKSMSSHEIAELTSKRHDNVLQLIRRLEVDQILSPEFQETVTMGRSLPVAYLNKRDSLVLVARLSPEFTAAIVDRWQKLEGEVLKPAELSRHQILTMALESENRAIELESQNQVLKDTCNVMVKQFVTGQTITKFCKMLNGVNVNEVNNYLITKGLLRRTGGGIEVLALGRDQYFKQEYTQVGDKQIGKALVLEKGAKYIYKKYLKGELKMKATWDGNYSHESVLTNYSKPPIVEPAKKLARPSLKAVK